MQKMNSATVDLIATDPPFNKNKDFHVTPDALGKGNKIGFHDRWSWDKDVHKDWVTQIKSDLPALMEAIESAREAHSDGMGAYMCYMAVRLREMRRLLKPTGSIYLHCDPTASHYLKAVMDAIFEWKNFRNEITWQRTRGKGLNPSRYVQNSDRILYYSRSGKRIWKQQYEAFEPGYGNDWREDEHGKWEAENLTGGKAGGPSAYEPFRGVLPAAGRAWAPPIREKFPPVFQQRLPDNYENLNQLEKCKALDLVGLIYWPKKKGGKPRYKKYLSTLAGRYVSDLITDIPPVSSQSKERNKDRYPTQKPLKLYERIIKASSNKGDIVLDPFAGCATTCIAAERLGRQWAGIDIWKGSKEVVIARMERQRAITGEDLVQRGKAPRTLFVELFTFTDKLPERTDDKMTAGMELPTLIKYDKKPWEKLSRVEMRRHLLEAQADKKNQDRYLCAGCGRSLEKEFLDMDHLNPKAGMVSRDTIDNRILLCRPCNLTKKDRLALNGLWKANVTSEWMENESITKVVVRNVKNRVLKLQHEM